MATVSETTSDPLAVATWAEEGEGPSKSERYLAKRLAAAGADFKGAAVTTFLLAAGVAAMLWLVCGVVAEHWLVPGGLPVWARWAWLGLGLAAFGAAVVRWLVPLMRYRVNLVYAARALEREHPELHNDVVNAVLARARAEATAPLVVKSLRRRAAKRLSDVPSDGVVDRTPAVRLAYALAVLVGLACVYELVAPKSLLTSAARLVAPWLGVSTPSRVRIEPLALAWRMPGEPETTPVGDRRLPVVGGQATIVRGRQLVVSARIRGLASGERAALVVTPVDTPGAAAGWQAPLTRGEDGEHVATVPDATRGMDHSVAIEILAGDARTDRLRVAVVDAASLLVRELRYDFPDYTRQADETIEWQGDIRAVEGTNVTVVAESNQPLEAAWLDLDCDGKRDVTLAIGPKDLTRARGTFTLRMNADRSGPEHAVYRLMFQPRSPTQAGREATVTEKLEHRIEVLPDLAPEVSIEDPAEKVVRVPPAAPVAIRVRASDPDFGLASVLLETRLQAAAARPGPELLGKPAKVFRGTAQIVPERLGAGPGTVLEYRAVAADGRPSQPNVKASDWYALKIDADAPPREPPPVPEAEGGSGEREGKEGDGDGSAGDGDAGPQDGREGATDNRGDEGDKGDAKDNGKDDAGAGERQGEDRADQAGSKPQDRRDSGSEQADDAQEREKSKRQQDPTGGDEQAAPQEGEEQGAGEGGKPQTGDQGKAGPQQGKQPQQGSEDGAGSEPQGQGGQGQAGNDQSGGQRQQQGGEAQPADGKGGGAGGKPQGQKQQGGQGGDQGRGEAGGGDHAEGRSGERAGAGERQGRDGKPKPKETVAADGTDDGKAMERILEHRREKGGEEPRDGVDERRRQDGPTDVEQTKTGETGTVSQQQQQNQQGQVRQNLEQKGPTKGRQNLDGEVGDVTQQQAQDQRGDIDQNEQQPGPTKFKQELGGEIKDVTQQQQQSQRNDIEQNQKQAGPTDIDQELEGKGKTVGQQEKEDQVREAKQQQDELGPTRERERRDARADDVAQQLNQTKQRSTDEQRADDQPTGDATQSGEGQAGRQQKAVSQDQRNQTQQGQSLVNQSQQRQTQQGQSLVDQSQQSQAQQGQSLVSQSQQSQSQRGDGHVGGDRPGQPPPGQAGDDPESKGKETEWGEQDLAHARNAADLAIEHLKKAVESGNGDVLDDLGWTPEQARAFLDRWEAMRRQAQEGAPGKKAEFDRAVKSLGIRPRGVRSSRDVPTDVKGGQAEGRRSRPPSDYREQFKAFMQATGSE